MSVGWSRRRPTSRPGRRHGRRWPGGLLLRRPPRPLGLVLSCRYALAVSGSLVRRRPASPVRRLSFVPNPFRCTIAPVRRRYRRTGARRLRPGEVVGPGPGLSGLPAPGPGASVVSGPFVRPCYHCTVACPARAGRSLSLAPASGTAGSRGVRLGSWLFRSLGAQSVPAARRLFVLTCRRAGRGVRRARSRSGTARSGLVHPAVASVPRTDGRLVRFVGVRGCPSDPFVRFATGS